MIFDKFTIGYMLYFSLLCRYFIDVTDGPKLSKNQKKHKARIFVKLVSRNFYKFMFFIIIEYFVPVLLYMWNKLISRRTGYNQ